MVKANFIDRLVNVVSPQAASRRLAYRQKNEILQGAGGQKRFYEGASQGRRTKDWFAAGGSADTHIAKAGRTLRDRCNELVRNNAYAAVIVSRHADNIVGTGIIPRARARTPERAREIDALFEEFSKTIDPEGVTNFYGMTYQAVRGMVGGGELLGRRRIRRASDGYKVPLQVQVVEPDLLDSGRVVATGPQNRIRNGIEFDAIGRRRGYYLFGEDPGASFLSTTFRLESSFVPASDVVHLFEPQRKQSRGVSWLSPIMVDLRDLDEYNEAEIVRKKTESCMVGIIIPGDETDEENPNIGLPANDLEGGEREEEEFDGPSIRDAQGDLIERVEPGMFAVARGGKDIKFNTPAISAGHEAYVRAQLRRIASGARMPYEVMTGDVSQASYATGRMGLIEYRRFVKAIQWHVVIPLWCQPIWDWFVEACRLVGLIEADEVVGVEWTTPKFESINPIDDARADLIEVRAGFKPWDEAVTERGFDPAVVAAQIETRNQDFDARGIVLDSDPRKVAVNGQLQILAGEGESNNGTQE